MTQQAIDFPVAAVANDLLVAGVDEAVAVLAGRWRRGRGVRPASPPHQWADDSKELNAAGATCFMRASSNVLLPGAWYWWRRENRRIILQPDAGLRMAVEGVAHVADWPGSTAMPCPRDCPAAARP